MSATLNDVRFRIYQLLAEMEHPLESDVLNAAFNAKFGSSIPYSEFEYPTLYDFLCAFLNDPNSFPDDAEVFNSSSISKYFIEKPIEVTVKLAIPLHQILSNPRGIVSNPQIESHFKELTFISSQISAIKEQPHYLPLPEDVLRRLNVIAEMYVGGISSSQLPTFYKFMFKQDLDYQRYNFATVEEMCRSLTDTFTCFCINNELMIYHKDHIRVRYVHDNTPSSN